MTAADVPGTPSDVPAEPNLLTASGDSAAAATGTEPDPPSKLTPGELDRQRSILSDWAQILALPTALALGLVVLLASRDELSTPLEALLLFLNLGALVAACGWIGGGILLRRSSPREKNRLSNRAMAAITALAVGLASLGAFFAIVAGRTPGPKVVGPPTPYGKITVDPLGMARVTPGSIDPFPSLGPAIPAAVAQDLVGVGARSLDTVCGGDQAQRSLELATGAIRLDAKNIDALYLKARAEYALGRWEASAHSSGNAYESGGPLTPAGVFETWARALQRAKNLSEANRVIDLGLGIHGDAPVLLGVKADLLTASDASRLRLELRNKAAEKAPKDPYYLAAAALEAAKQDPTQAAAQGARLDAVQETDRTAWTWWARGRIADLEGHPDIAAAAARSGLVLASCPDLSAHLHLDLGRYLVGSGMAVAALPEIETALKTHPEGEKWVWGEENRVWAYIAAKRPPDDIVRLATDAISAVGSTSQLEVYLADTLSWKGDIGAAIDHYTAALVKSEHWVEPLRDRAVLRLYRLQPPDLAGGRADLVDIVEHGSALDVAWAAWELASAATEAGETQDALRWNDMAIKNRGDPADYFQRDSILPTLAERKANCDELRNRWPDRAYTHVCSGVVAPTAAERLAEYLAATKAEDGRTSSWVYSVYAAQLFADAEDGRVDEEALMAAETAVSLVPTASAAFELRARMRLTWELDLPGAEQDARAAVDLDAGSRLARKTLAEVLSRKKDYVGAGDAYRQCGQASQPKSRGANYCWALAAEAFHNAKPEGPELEEDALRAIDVAIAVSADDPWDHSMRASILRALGREDDARGSEDRADELAAARAKDDPLVRILLVAARKSSRGDHAGAAEAMVNWRNEAGDPSNDQTIIGRPFHRAADFANIATFAEAWDPAATLCEVAAQRPDEYIVRVCGVVAQRLEGATAARAEQILEKLGVSDDERALLTADRASRVHEHDAALAAMTSWRQGRGDAASNDQTLIGRPFHRAADFARSAADDRAWGPAAALCSLAADRADEYITATCQTVAGRLEGKASAGVLPLLERLGVRVEARDLIAAGRGSERGDHATALALLTAWRREVGERATNDETEIGRPFHRAADYANLAKATADWPSAAGLCLLAAEMADDYIARVCADVAAVMGADPGVRDLARTVFDAISAELDSDSRTLVIADLASGRGDHEGALRAMAEWQKGARVRSNEPTLIGLPLDRAADFAAAASNDKSWEVAAKLCAIASSPRMSGWVVDICSGVGESLVAAGQLVWANQLFEGIIDALAIPTK